MLLFGLVLDRMTVVQGTEYWRALESDELLRRQAEALAVARREAEQASRAKSTFLANISHELRTPLHGNLSYARFGMNRVGGGARFVAELPRVHTADRVADEPAPV